MRSSALLAATGHRGAKLFAWRFSEQRTANLEKISLQFVTCFSPSGDDLSQCGSLRRGRKKDFALGFDGPGLETAFGTILTI